MTGATLALVLAAALLHASWNALLRAGQDRVWTMAVMDLALAAGGVAVVAVTGLPIARSLPWVAASGLLHCLYNALLVRTYRSGDLGETYPIARGSSPALVALGASLVAGERMSGAGLLGVALVTAGIATLVLARGPGLRVASLPAAFATGATIACYTVVDGVGVRVSGDWLAYTGAMFTLELLFPLWFVASRGVGAMRGSAREVAKACCGGAVSFVAYGAVICALRLDAMGAVSALRETSVVFAALIGRFWLGEVLTAKRLAACGMIALGAACLAWA